MYNQYIEQTGVIFFKKYEQSINISTESKKGGFTINQLNRKNERQIKRKIKTSGQVKIPVAYQNKDIISKVFGESMRNKSFRAYGMDIPEIVEILPTNLPAVEANEMASGQSLPAERWHDCDRRL